MGPLSRTELAYPWELLDVIPRETVRAARRVRPALGAAVATGRVAAALREVLNSDVAFAIERVGSAAPPPASDTTVSVELDGGALRIAVELERPLAAGIVARVLGRPARLDSSERALDAPLRGAVAAIFADVVRRVASTPVSLAPLPSSDAGGLEVLATVFVDERPYRARVWAQASPLPTRPPPGEAVGRLGRTPISLPLVAATSLATPEDLAALDPGDVWLPGDGWTADLCRAGKEADSRFEGRCAVIAPSGERGRWLECAPGGRLVLTPEIATLPMDVDARVDPGAPPSDPEGLQSSQGDVEPGGGDTTAPRSELFPAPRVVRVEVATITLDACDWVTLAPGQDLSAGVDWQAPVVLRVAGQVYRRGELVRVGDECGVRVQAPLTAHTDL